MGPDEGEATALMPLETPILKVSRPVAACLRCRNAKIKCDGLLPACSSCEKSGRAAECTSTNDQFARGKERSYVSTLETKIDRLQARLHEARARKPSVVSIPDDELTVQHTRQQPHYAKELPTSSNTSKAMRRKEATAIDDLVSDFGFLSVNATARDFYGFTTAMSYARLILSASAKDPLPQGMTQPLPPRYAATALIQHYLNNVFVLLPVFDEASFYASVENVYSKDARSAEPLDHWNVRLVLATSSASMSEQRGDQHYIEALGHVCAALEHAEVVLHPGSIASVQALVLLTEYAMLDPHHFDSWCLIGAASRAMIDLGMHQDPARGTAMPKGKLDLRRRVFYCIYTLDRSTSLVQTRAFSFSDDSAKVKVPFSRPPGSAPTSPLGHPAPQKLWLQSYDQALELINLRKLQSVWYTDLFQSGRSRWDDPYPYIWSTCDALRKWFENLPSSTPSNMRAFFELDLLYSYVYVLSPSPRVPVTNPFPRYLIYEYCIRYADLMLRLISDPAYTAPLTFYDAMRVYMTGRQFLDVLQHDTNGLLSGHMPPPPEVKPTAVPPPSIPRVPLPPGETAQRFNIMRSITCIKQIADCLSRFGIRWGYMSWNQRFQSETTGMLNDLNMRLRDLDEMSGRQQPSMWSHHSSTGSAASSNSSSMSYPGFTVPYAPNVVQLIPGVGGAAVGHQHVGPPQYQQQPQPYPLAHAHPTPPAQPPFPFPAPVFEFNQAPAPPQTHAFQPGYTAHSHPGQQFANWTGYTGPGAASSPLEDDKAVPPNATIWKHDNQ